MSEEPAVPHIIPVRVNSEPQQTHQQEQQTVPEADLVAVENYLNLKASGEELPEDIDEAKVAQDALRWFIDMKRQNKALEYENQHDKLTGLLNKEALMKMAEAKEREGKLEAILVIDLDRFKSVNDVLGHLRGDEVLVKVADMLKVAMRENDLIARWGGDEFVAMLSDESSERLLKAIKSLDERIKANFALYTMQHEELQEIGFGFSMGWAYVHGGDVEEAVERADKAMYEDKQNNRRQYAGVSDTFSELR